jgi:hypothetical protein
VTQTSRMRRALKIIAAVVGVLLSVIWFLFSIRLIALPLLAMLIVVLSIPSLRIRRTLLTGTWFAFLAATLLPFDVTLRMAPGPPHFVSCCPGIPYRDYHAALEKARRGTCLFCSDLFTGFEPRYYLIW